MSLIVPPTPKELEGFIQQLCKLPIRARRRIITALDKNPYPRFIYKYRNLDSTSERSLKIISEIVVDSKLWLSSPADFNDPFDMGLHIRVEGTPEEKRERIKRLVREHGAKSWKDREHQFLALMKKSNEEFRAIGQESHKKHVALFGVCSFAGSAKSILMWSHYTSEHRGICLQFDLAHDPRVFLQAIPVDYEGDYPSSNWLKDDLDEESLTTKFKDWAYENERRILVPDAANNHIQFSPASLSGVIFGCKVRRETVDAVKEMLDARYKRGLPTVALYSAEMHPTKYKIVVREYREHSKH